jgi:hypothetical protein
VHPKVAQIVLRRDKEDKGDKGDKGDSTVQEKYICTNGMLPRLLYRRDDLNLPLETYFVVP